MTGMPDEPNDMADTKSASGLRDIVALVSKGRTPLQVGDVELDEHGRIRRRRADRPLRFVFAYRGADFEARMETSPVARVTLCAELGKMPYSMEPGTGRRVTQRIVGATADLPGGRIEISKSQDMSLVATAHPPLPLTPASVMAAITSLLLDFGPYIDLLRETLVLAEARHGPAAGASSQTPPAPASSSAP